MKSLRPRATAIGMAFALVAAAGCGNGEASSSTPAAPPPAPERGEAVALSTGEDRAYFFGEQDVQKQSEVTVVANYSQDPSVYYFSPTILTGEPGQTLRVKVVNRAFQAHTFTIDEQGIDEKLSPKSATTVEVVFPEEGGVTFYCAYHFGGSTFQAGELRVR